MVFCNFTDFVPYAKRCAYGVVVLIGMITAAAPAAQADALDDYLALTTGTFDSSAQAAQDDRYDHAIWHKAKIWPEQNDGRWAYTENWLAGAKAPYRQRITQYTLDEHGAIKAQGYIIANAEKYVGAAQDTSLLDGLALEDLTATGTCPAFVARTGATRFESSTVGQSCQNNYKGASYVVSRSITDETGFTNWDRGFNAQGELVWGPSAGGYQFVRSGESQ